MNKELVEKNTKINQQYAPINAMIDTIPDQSFSMNGLDYSGASSNIKAGLSLVVMHCVNMKLIDADFELPFSKTKLEELTTAPFTKSKLSKVKELAKKYAELDDEAHANRKGAKEWQATA